MTPGASLGTTGTAAIGGGATATRATVTGGDWGAISGGSIITNVVTQSMTMAKSERQPARYRALALALGMTRSDSPNRPATTARIKPMTNAQKPNILAILETNSF